MKTFCERFRPLVFSLLLIGGITLEAGPLAAATEEITIVAVVNQDIITSYDLEQAMHDVTPKAGGTPDPKKARFDVLEGIIRDRLLEQEFAQLGIQAGEQEVNEEWQRIVKRSQLSEERFREELRKEGMTPEQYRKTLADHLKLVKFIGRKIRPRIGLDDKDFRQEYERNAVAYSEPEKVHLVEIRLPRALPARDSEAFRARLTRGLDSVEQFKRENPGAHVEDLGVIVLADLSADSRKQVEPLKSGEVSQAVGRGKGVSYFKVLNRVPGKPLPFDTVRETIRMKLFEKEVEQQMELYLANVRRSSHVEIRL